MECQIPGAVASPHSPEYKALRRRLRDARRRAGMTQSEVAEKLGKYQSFISKVETGERRLDPVELMQLARLYGVEPADLLPAESPRQRGVADGVAGREP